MPKDLVPAARANTRYFKTHLTTLEDVELPDDIPMKDPDLVQDAEYPTTKKGYALVKIIMHSCMLTSGTHIGPRTQSRASSG
jgi:hypothetical protein